MRESIGSVWLTGIVATFIAIFAGFLAYAISYTKAFRVKNELLNIIEKNEGYTEMGRVLENVPESELSRDTHTDAKIYAFIKSIGYNYTMFDNKANPCKEGKLKEGGYCLVKYCNNDGRIHYKVTTYISLTVPVINVGVNLPISGETKSIYYDNSTYECDVRGE